MNKENETRERVWQTSCQTLWHYGNEYLIISEWDFTNTKILLVVV